MIATGESAQKNASDEATNSRERRPRVLMLLMEPTPYILPRARLLAQNRDFDCRVVFTLRNSSQDWGADADAKGFPILLETGSSRIEQFRRVIKLLSDIFRKRFDAIHLAGWGHWVVQLAIVSSKMAGVPFSVESDTQLREENGFRRAVKELLYPVWLKWPAAVVPGGKRQAEFFRHYGVEEERIFIARMTVDTERIRNMITQPRAEFRKALGLADDDVLALYVGRLEWYKGVEVLMKAFERAKASCTRLKLAIVGDGRLMSQVEEFAERIGGSTVLVAGRQEYSKVIAWMRSSDFLVLPSMREQWGLVVNEAMVCGLPIIASDACGCSDDLVHEQVNGYGFRSEDWEKLAQRMTELASNANMRLEMGRASERIIQPWNAEGEAETLGRVFLRLVSAG